MQYAVIELKARGLVKGQAQGEALVTNQPLSFLGGVNPETGKIIEKGHELQGLNIKQKILVFPYGKGSTVGSYTLFAMLKRNTKPAGIININTEPIIATGCVLARIPLMDRPDKNPVEVISTGDFVVMDPNKRKITIIRKLSSTLPERK